MHIWTFIIIQKCPTATSNNTHEQEAIEVCCYLQNKFRKWQKQSNNIYSFLVFSPTMTLLSHRAHNFSCQSPVMSKNTHILHKYK